MKKYATGIALSIAMMASVMAASPVHAEGYWTDAWTDASVVWHDGYWAETSSADTCGWVTDWSRADGGYCSYQAGSSSPAVANNGVQTYAGDSIYIPGLGYSVSLSADGDPQWVVDQAGLGWYSYWTDGHLLIGDHAYQGLGKLGSLPNGSTATLTVGGVTRTITKASGYTGYNYGNSMRLADGRDLSEVWDGSIVIYTCSAGSSGDKIVITFWN